MKNIIIAAAMVMLMAVSGICSDKPVISVNQIVEHPSLDAMRNGFMDILKEAGIDAEYNVHIAQGNQATNIQIASQIMGEKPDLILAITTPSSQVIARKIKNIPVVFSGVTDPVAAGLVSSLEAPGANVTGMTDMSPVDEHLALIREFVPGLKTLGVLYNSGEPNSVVLLEAMKAEAEQAGIAVEEATAINSGAVYQAAKSLVGRCDAVYVPVDNTVVSALESAVKVCSQNRLPLFTADTDSVDRGSIAALAVDYYRMGRQTGEMALRILKDGAKPAEMPVESLKNLRLHVNMKSAAAMGVTVPETVLKRADKIVE